VTDIYVEGGIRGISYKFSIMADDGRALTLADFDGIMRVIDMHRDVAFADELDALERAYAERVADSVAKWAESFDWGAPGRDGPSGDVTRNAAELPVEPTVEPLLGRDAECAVCHKRVTLNQDGSLRVHGPKAARCGSAPVTTAEAAPAPLEASTPAPEAAGDPGATQEAEDWFADTGAAATSVDDLAKAVF
jgi:hypothetical protein